MGSADSDSVTSSWVMTQNHKSPLSTNNAAHYPQCRFPCWSAYPFGLELRKRQVFVFLGGSNLNNTLHKSQHTHRTLASHPIQFAVLFSLLSFCFWFFFFLFLSQLRPTIPSDLKRLNQCLCQTTSQQPLATADIIHLFLLTNLSIHSREMKLLPLFFFFVCLHAAAHWHMDENARGHGFSVKLGKEESSEVMSKWHMLIKKKGILGIKYWSQIHSVCKGGNQPRESLLWFKSICINPPNYAFNKWSSPRELPVHSRLAYSRQHNHRLVYRRRKKNRNKERGGERKKEKTGTRANQRNSRGKGGGGGDTKQTCLFWISFSVSQQ